MLEETKPLEMKLYEFAFDRVTTLEELSFILSSLGITLDQNFVDNHPELAEFITEKP
jgi:hypothetical protein